MDLLIEAGQNLLAAYGPRLLEGITTLIVGVLVAKWGKRALRRVLTTSQLDATAAAFCANLAYVTMLTLVAITSLDRFGFPAVSFAAVVGAAGLAIGLALKGTLSNFAAGVILIAMRPFNVGDRIEAAGVNGTVAEIRVFATILTTEDKKRIIIPNAAVAGGTITNHSAV